MHLICEGQLLIVCLHHGSSGNTLVNAVLLPLDSSLTGSLVLVHKLVVVQVYHRVLIYLSQVTQWAFSVINHSWVRIDD